MKLYKALALTLGLLSLSILLHSCVGASKPTAYQAQESAEARYLRDQERLRREYGSELDIAAQRMVRVFSKELSPRSGKDWQSTVHLYDYEIIENNREGYVACRATLRWMARDFWSGVGYDWCQLDGVLYFYPKLRSVDRMRAEFKIDRRNEHVTKIADTADWNRVKNGLTIDL